MKSIHHKTDSYEFHVNECLGNVHVELLIEVLWLNIISVDTM